MRKMHANFLEFLALPEKARANTQKWEHHQNKHKHMRGVKKGPSWNAKQEELKKGRGVTRAEHTNKRKAHHHRRKEMGGKEQGRKAKKWASEQVAVRRQAKPSNQVILQVILQKKTVGDRLGHHGKQKVSMKTIRAIGFQTQLWNFHTKPIYNCWCPIGIVDCSHLFLKRIEISTDKQPREFCQTDRSHDAYSIWPTTSRVSSSFAGIAKSGSFPLNHFFLNSLKCFLGNKKLKVLKDLLFLKSFFLQQTISFRCNRWIKSSRY